MFWYSVLQMAKQKREEIDIRKDLSGIIAAQAMELVLEDPELNEKALEFATLIAIQRVSYAVAYEQVFDCEGLTDRAIQCRAVRLKDAPAIKRVLSLILREHYKKVGFTLHDHLHNLEEIRYESMIAGNYTAAHNAEKSKGQCLGFYVERHADVTKQASMDDLLAKVEKLFGKEGVEQAKKKLGLTTTYSIEGEKVDDSNNEKS